MSIHESVTCPHCQKSFKLSEAFSKNLEASVKAEIEKEFKLKEELLTQKVEGSKKEIKELSTRLEDDKKNLESKFEANKLDFLQKLKQEKAQHESKIEAVKIEVKNEIEMEANSKAEAKYLLECKDLKNSVDEQKEQLKTANDNQLKLRARQRELEQKEQQFELNMQKQLLDQEQVLQVKIRKEVDDEINLKMAVKDKVLENMKTEVATLQRKLEQGSQQLQGEVLELHIEALIREKFPEDEVTEVKKGARGADIQHKVMMSSGRIAGVIFAECKDVKEWSAQWPIKLKSDMRDKGADIGVIVSTALPKDIKGTAFIDGVWVCTPSYFLTLITLLRDQLLKVKSAELRSAVPSEHKDFLFQYMTSNKFVHKVQGVCEMADSMKATLETERRSIQKNWKKRETEIDQICLYMGEMYGELQGLVGKALPRVDALELGTSTDSE